MGSLEYFELQSLDKIWKNLEKTTRKIEQIYKNLEEILKKVSKKTFIKAKQHPQAGPKTPHTICEKFEDF